VKLQVLTEEEEGVEQHTWSSTRGAYTIRPKKGGKLEIREGLASECHWEGLAVASKEQKTTKQQTKKKSELDSQPY
jgi:hypothetical protein